MDDESTRNGSRGGVTQPAGRGDERTTLRGYLQRQRDLVAWKLRDVPDDDLRSVSTPSGLTPHGVVRHLENVERSWFRDVFAGEENLRFDWTDESPMAEWHVPDDVTMADLLADYTVECERCDTVIAAAPSLDEVAEKDDCSLRWILLHMIEETGRHVGHIDLLRERVDGAVGEDPE
jgi:hypothetical protein